MKLLLILVVIVMIVLFFCLFNCQLTCGPGARSKFMYPIFEAGHRPSLGDFLPTVGEVPTEGGYVDLNAMQWV